MLIPDVNACGEIISISNTITKTTYFNARNKRSLVLVRWETKTGIQGLELYKSVREHLQARCGTYAHTSPSYNVRHDQFCGYKVVSLLASVDICNVM